MTAPWGFAITTATPLQRAIWRVSDGLPIGDLWNHPDVAEAFGGVLPPEVAPKKLLILAGIRGAKSMTAAAKAIQCSQTCDLTGVSPGDEVRIPVLSYDKDTAHAVYSQIVGHLQERPALRQLMIGEPTEDSVWLRHPSGKPIEVRVTALSRHGSTLVGRWLAGCVFDEAPRMAGEESVKNLIDSLRAIAGRMRPGAQIMLIGSPYAPVGPVYDMVQEYFGKPSEDIVIVRGRGPAMNPVHWNPKACADLLRENPAAHRTDVLAEFSDPEEAIFSAIEVANATRTAPLEIPPSLGIHYVAACDPATRGNAWTLVVLGCSGLGGFGGAQAKYFVAYVRQWVGSKVAPLSPDAVLTDIAAILTEYGLDTATSDQHQFDTLRDLAATHGLTLVEEAITSENRLKMVERARLLTSVGLLELPPDPVFRSDLLSARRRVTQNGVTLILPKTGDGRHADYVPALALSLIHPPELPDLPGTRRDPDLERHLAKLTIERAGSAVDRAARRISHAR